MMKRTILFLSSLFITIAVIVLLLTGSSYLTLALNNAASIPLGTPLTWIGLIALPTTIYWGIKELRKPAKLINKILSVLLKIVITLSLTWLPISYLLAGNLSFTFTDKEAFQGSLIAMLWFWRFNYGIVGAALTIIVVYWFALLFKRN